MIKSILLIYCITMTSCAYRFSNLRRAAPNGIRSLAVEAIFDTTRHVLPHDNLWSEVQLAVIASGRFRLESSHKADAILRLHLKKASNQPIGGIEGEKFKKDPTPNEDGIPIAEFRNLTRAGSWTVREYISAAIHYELIALDTGQIIKQGTITGGSKFLTARTAAQAPLKSHFLRYEEDREAAFTNISQGIAQKIVNSILAAG